MVKLQSSVLALACALAVVGPLAAQNVDEGELSSTRTTRIEFINYEGPHQVIETAAAIRGIGQELGRAVASGRVSAGDATRYSVRHIVDPSVPTGFDADIITLGASARVDHVRNLRRIVAGYLETAYGYAPKDADTLGTFITIYNAVYRGKADYFTSKYKPAVVKAIDMAKVGLSTRWTEWAGSSQIVIPLSARAGMGVTGSIDTTPITDEATVKALKQESPTAGIEERIDVVDIKERGQDEERAAIEAERQRIAQEEKAIADEKARVEAERAAAAAAAEAAAKAAATATPAGEGDGTAGATDGTTGTVPDSVATGQATERAAEGSPSAGTDQEASITASDKAREEDAAIAAREAQVEKDRQDLAAREDAVAAKDEEIAADRTGIADDQKKVIQDQVAAAAGKEAGGTVLFELMDPNQPLSRIALVDLKTGETLRRSTINTIRASTVVDVGQAWVAVAGQSTGTGGLVRLVRVAKNDYSDVVQGTTDVFADTMLWKFGASVYAIVPDGGSWAVGRFDPATLELKAKSAQVSRFTFLTESGGKLVAQSPGGVFLLLEAEALTTASELKR